MKKRLDQQMLDAMQRNPSNWRGLFYFNRKDPRIIVPKLHPLTGWTFNFGCPYSYVALAAIILIIVIASLFS